MKTYDLAHRYWSEILEPGDTAIDATVGNGHDTLVLAKLGRGKVIGYDIQKEALQRASLLLEPYKKSVTLLQKSHVSFDVAAAKLIVYNLGYLPGGDKRLTTKRESTLESLGSAQKILLPGGALSVTCYPGHSEGQAEEEAILEWSQTLLPREWSVCLHRWINRHLAPSLILIKRHLLPQKEFGATASHQGGNNSEKDGGEEKDLPS